ncbi:hypothetical protein KKC94_01070, partial [Patescibacteria group bacterium]|nr:hypothetical protein [Patescibacteria group bacterium]
MSIDKPSSGSWLKTAGFLGAMAAGVIMCPYGKEEEKTVEVVNVTENENIASLVMGNVEFVFADDKFSVSEKKEVYENLKKAYK